MHAQGSHHVHPINGARLLAEPPVHLRGPAIMRADFHVGAYTVLGRSLEAQGASIGRYCEVGPYVLLGAVGHPTDWLGVSSFQYKTATWSWHDTANDCTPVNPDSDPDGPSFRGAVARIGNDVWIGANVVVLAGVSVGDGAVIGANSVVTKDVEPYLIVGGVPAKPIRKRFDDATVAELLELAWWRFTPNQLDGIAFDQITVALKEVRARIEDGLTPYLPEAVEIKKKKKPAAMVMPAPSTAKKRRFRR